MSRTQHPGDPTVRVPSQSAPATHWLVEHPDKGYREIEAHTAIVETEGTLRLVDADRGTVAQFAAGQWSTAIKSGVEVEVDTRGKDVDGGVGYLDKVRAGLLLHFGPNAVNRIFSVLLDAGLVCREREQEVPKPVDTEDTLSRVVEALTKRNWSRAAAGEVIDTLLGAGIVFREVR